MRLHEHSQIQSQVSNQNHLCGNYKTEIFTEKLVFPIGNLILCQDWLSRSGMGAFLLQEIISSLSEPGKNMKI